MSNGPGSNEGKPVEVNLGCGSIGCAGVILAIAVLWNIPYAEALRRSPDDPGVAAYFVLNGKAMAMACDLYTTPHENMHSLGHAIEHLRGLDRHGGGHMIERAFSGFVALAPPDAAKSWWEILGVSRNASRETILAAHRSLVAENHPDRGGDPQRMSAINAARDSGLAEGTVQ